MNIITNKVKCKNGFIFIPYNGKPLEDNQEYQISIKKHVKRRTLNANAYAWVLLEKLAKVLKTTKIEVYKECIKDVGVFHAMPIQNNALERFCSVWEQNGIGWQVEKLGECKQSKDFTNVLAYYGTSTYNSSEMARFIEHLIDECKRLEIEVLDPIKIEAMLSEWGGADD